MYQKWNAGTSLWEDLFRTTYSYDANNDNTQQFRKAYDKNTNTWNNRAKSELSFDASHNNLSQENYNWDSPSNTWINGNLSTWEYYANGCTSAFDNFYSWDPASSRYVSHIRYEYRSTFVSTAVKSVSTSIPRIFPNPVLDNTLHVQVNSNSNFELYDLTGRLQYSGLLKTGENILELPQIPKGIYIFRSGNSRQKLVVE